MWWSHPVLVAAAFVALLGLVAHALKVDASNPTPEIEDEDLP